MEGTERTRTVDSNDRSEPAPTTWAGHALLSGFVRNSPDAIIATSPDGTVRLWNDGATQLYGWDATEMLGQSFYRVVVPSARRGGRSC